MKVPTSGGTSGCKQKVAMFNVCMRLIEFETKNAVKKVSQCFRTGAEENSTKCPAA